MANSFVECDSELCPFRMLLGLDWMLTCEHLLLLVCTCACADSIFVSPLVSFAHIMKCIFDYYPVIVCIFKHMLLHPVTSECAFVLSGT